MKIIILIFIIANACVLAVSAVCPTNTALWCESVETAKECNVYKNCLKYVWLPTHKFPTHERVSSADRVNFTLYYETLCPDCRHFMSGELWKAYQSVSSIMSLTVVPYGNAQQSWNSQNSLWTFKCQHGADECYGNTLHSCLLFYRPKTTDYLPFIHCMESNNADTVKVAAVKCGQQLNITLDKVFDCVSSKLGNMLQHRNADLTEALQPEHQYVPWVTINGVHTEDIEQQAENDLVKLICDTYQGDDKPVACSN